MIHVYYHKSDLDGICSGAIAHRHFGAHAKYHGVDYCDCPLDLDPDAEANIFVDFSPEGTPRDELPSNVFVIDHHKTAVGLPGIIDTTQAACVLVWKHFFPQDVLPRAVELIAKGDIWAKDDPEWDTNVVPFGTAVKHDAWGVTDPRWEHYFWDDRQVLPAIFRGRVLVEFNDRQQAEIVKEQAFVTKFHGLNFLAVIGGIRGSFRFDSIRDPKIHDAVMVIRYIGNGLWQYSMYAENRNDLDMSAIAQQHGGGGHKGAAGFVADKLLVS